jgi:hypothetical protein
LKELGFIRSFGMENRAELKRLVTKGADIIEIGPYHSGLFKKAKPLGLQG